NEKAILRKKLTPLVVEQCAIGLDVVFDALAGTCMPALKLKNPPEKRNAAKRRLATLPREYNGTGVESRELLLDEGLQRFVRHSRRPRSARQTRLREIETIVASEIAR